MAILEGTLAIIAIIGLALIGICRHIERHT